MLKLKIRGIAAAVLAGALLAGCSGGGSKSVLPSTPSQSGTVQTTMTITIGGAGTQTATRNGQTIPALNSKSLVFRYVGDVNTPNAPTNAFAFPGTAPAASVGGNAFWNIASPPCTTIGATLTCTVPGVTLPIGTIDLYVLDYDAVGGTGNLIYGSVTTVVVTSAGAILSIATGQPTTLNTLGANVAAPGVTVAFNGVPTTLSPTSAVKTAAATPVNLPNANPGFKVTGTDANGLALNGTINPMVVTDTDTSGNTCLLLVKGGGAAGANTCTMTAGSTSAVTVTSTNDSIYLQYNNAPIGLAGFNITLAPQTGTTPSTVTQAVAFAGLGFPTAFTNNRALATLGTTVYGSTGAGTAFNTEMKAWTFAGGKLTLVATLPVTGIGAAGAFISSMAGGPDSNLYFADTQAATHDFIGVYAVATAAGVNGLVPIAKGTVAETGDIIAQTSGAASTINGIAQYGGYLWAVTDNGDLIRIDPNNIQAASTSAGLVVVQHNTNNLAWPSNANPSGGLVGVNGVGLFLVTNAPSIVKIALPNLAVNATAANLVPAASITESVSTPAQLNGIILASDGNLWTGVNSAGVGPFTFASQSLALGSVTGVATATNYGGVAQGGPDNAIFMNDSTNGLSWSLLGGTKVGKIGDGPPSAGACVPPAAASFSGQPIVGLSSYLLYTTATSICVAVP